MPMVAFGMLLCRSRSDGGTWLGGEQPDWQATCLNKAAWVDRVSTLPQDTMCRKAWSETVRWPRLFTRCHSEF